MSENDVIDALLTALDAGEEDEAVLRQLADAYEDIGCHGLSLGYRRLIACAYRLDEPYRMGKRKSYRWYESREGMNRRDLRKEVRQDELPAEVFEELQYANGHASQYGWKYMDYVRRSHAYHHLARILQNLDPEREVR